MVLRGWESQTTGAQGTGVRGGCWSLDEVCGAAGTHSRWKKHQKGEEKQMPLGKGSGSAEEVLKSEQRCSA